MREFALSVFSFPSLFQCIDEGEADLRGKGTEGNREPCLLAAPTFKKKNNNKSKLCRDIFVHCSHTHLQFSKNFVVKPCFPRFENILVNRPVSFPDDTINPVRCTELQAGREGQRWCQSPDRAECPLL